MAPRTLEPLLAHMDAYWADYAANAELFLSPSMNGTYPPAAFLPGAEAGTRVAVPATLEELRADLLDASPARTAILTCITPFDTSHNGYYEAALCSGVNDWMRTEFLERDARLRGSLVLPTLDPDAAVAEIERLGGHPGFVQVLLPIRTEAPYGNPRYHRIWAAAARHGLVVGLHAWGRVGNAPTASGFTHSYLEDYAEQLPGRRPGARHQPRLGGRVRALRRAARRAARVRLRVAAVPALALRQGLEGRLARGPVGQGAPVGVRPPARPPHDRARAAAGRSRACSPACPT